MQTHLWGSAFCAPRFRCGGLGIFGVSRQEPVSSAPLSRQQATLLMALLFPKPLNGAQTRLSLHCCLESCIQGIAPKVPKAEISKRGREPGRFRYFFALWCSVLRCHCTLHVMGEGAPCLLSQRLRRGSKMAKREVAAQCLK